MLKKILFAAGLAGALTFALRAEAGPIEYSGAFSFSGTSISGSGMITVGPYTPPSDPNPLCGTAGNNPCRHDPPSAFQVFSISGTVTDTALGLNGAAITGLVPASPANERDPTFDPLVPASLSFIGGTTPGTYFSYDDLYYPHGAPIVCDFPFTGTSLDPFGIAFTVAGGDTVDLWGDGNFGSGSPPGGYLTYGVGVISGDTILSNQFNNVSATFDAPEPGSGALIAAGLLLLLGFTVGPDALRRRQRRCKASA